MEKPRLARIGMAAHSLGLIDLEGLSMALLCLGELGQPAPAPEDFWVGRGYLTAEHFARALDAIEGPIGELDRPTTPYQDGPPASLLAKKHPSSSKIAIDPAASAAMTRVVVVEQEAARLLAASPPTMFHPDAGPAQASDRPAAAAPGSGQAPGDEEGDVVSSLSMGGLPRPNSAPSLGALAEPERYQVRRLLGAGGMGEVYECLDSVLGRRIALKRLRMGINDDPVAVAMLEREARVIGSLEHPNIIPVYDAGYREDMGPFYTMRMLQRPSLEALLRKLHAGDAATLAEYTLHRLLRAFIQVCGAVDYAHSHGVVHCDLKPANVLLGAFGEVLVVDWGLAQSPHEASAYRGGTPGYMAPEQMENRPIDARTDIYALGAILYEVLTLRQAFPDRPDSSAPGKERTVHSPGRRPVHPRSRAPERNIPEDLVDACLKALEIDPARRFQGASEFASAIETFLEGTRERERREQRARELAEQGDTLADSYEELLESRPERVAEVNELHGGIPPWETTETKQALWDAEDRQAVLDALCIRTFQAAISAYEQALDEVPGFDPARRGMVRLYRAELHRAHERRDDFDRVYFEGLLRQYDTAGSAAFSGGSIAIDSSPEPVEVTLCHVQESGRRLIISREEPLGTTPVKAANLPTGSYILRLSRTNFFDVICPVLLRPGQELSQVIDVRGGADQRPGEIFIPGGPALLGGDETNLHGRDLHLVDVPAFFISTFPVSFHEYFEFLADLYASDPVGAAQYLPVNTDGTPYWIWTGEGFTPTRVTTWSDDHEYLLSLPVFGVDLICAEAYASWKSETTGRRYRLPTEHEWEKAARGTDGRRYPWGDRFDASFCKMRESRPDLPRPEPSGTFPFDASPYGVRDMAGSIAEWVLPPGQSPGTLVSQVATRGGAWCDWRVDCYLGARRAYFIEERSARVGFRLVREPRSSLTTPPPPPVAPA